jgi:hypothetical protein
LATNSRRQPLGGGHATPHSANCVADQLPLGDRDDSISSGDGRWYLPAASRRAAFSSRLPIQSTKKSPRPSSSGEGDSDGDSLRHFASLPWPVGDRLGQPGYNAQPTHHLQVGTKPIVFPLLTSALPALLPLGHGARAWMRYCNAEVYIRIGARVMPGRAEQVRCVQIANVSVAARHRRKGEFTRLVGRICELTDLPLMLENVISRSWATALVEHHGWVMGEDRGSQIDLWLMRNGNDG